MERVHQPLLTSSASHNLIRVLRAVARTSSRYSIIKPSIYFNNFSLMFLIFDIFPSSTPRKEREGTLSSLVLTHLAEFWCGLQGDLVRGLALQQGYSSGLEHLGTVSLQTSDCIVLIINQSVFIIVVIKKSINASNCVVWCLWEIESWSVFCWESEECWGRGLTGREQCEENPGFIFVRKCLMKKTL